jgi:histidinol-phosphate phosphatase family protein
MTYPPAIFLDRDGTIIEDLGYIRDPADVVFFPESFNALDILQKRFELFIITNQSGISKGITTEKEVITVNDHLVDILKSRNIPVRDVFVCPHVTDENCQCRKPSPFFINKAANQYHLNLSDSFIIGDHPSDVLCGINAGVTPIFLLTGHGSHHVDEIPPGIKVCETILDAANYILQKINKEI